MPEHFRRHHKGFKVESLRQYSINQVGVKKEIHLLTICIFIEKALF